MTATDPKARVTFRLTRTENWTPEIERAASRYEEAVAATIDHVGPETLARLDRAHKAFGAALLATDKARRPEIYAKASKARAREIEPGGRENALAVVIGAGLAIARRDAMDDPATVALLASAIRILFDQEDAEALATARREGKAEGPDWQPIKTAPKDGTYIDIWTVPGGRRTNCHWSGENLGRPGWYRSDGGSDSGYSTSSKIEGGTHWLPRPPPPALRAEASKQEGE